MRSEGSRRLAAVPGTQRQKAARIGVGLTTINYWISGERFPSEDHRRMMFAAWGIPIECWPAEWVVVRDIIVSKLATKAPDLLREIVDELKRNIG